MTEPDPTPAAEGVSSQEAGLYREPGIARIAARTAGVLLLFTLFFTALMAGMHSATEDRLAASAMQQKMRLIGEVLPPASYDNDLLADAITLPPQNALANTAPTTLYRARRAGEPVAVVFEAAANDGYSGRIDLLMAVGVDGRVIALRVIQHKETPGLGDYIDPRKDRNKARPWITQFTAKGFDEVPQPRWQVRKDGGDFEQMNGATISARAVTRARGRALAWAIPRMAMLVALPAGATPDAAALENTR